MVKKPARHLLWRKLIRDILGSWKAFASILIICTLSVTLYLGINAAALGMEKRLNELFHETSLASLWVSGELSDRTTRLIAQIPDVEDAQRRVRLRVKADLDGEPKLDLYMTDGEARVSMPMILEGSPLPEKSRNACVVDQKFAAARNVNVGDRISVSADSLVRELVVVGICYSPEYVVHSDGYGFNVDPYTFGYAFAAPGVLSDLPYNETVILTKDGADADAIKQSVENLVDDASVPVLTREDKVYIKMAVDEADQVRAMGRIFPAVFFFVAALITFSTMRRLVENQRLQLGTIYSLGYDRGQLMRHYAGYGFFIALLGALLGTLGARYFLGNIVMEMLSSLYAMPGVGVFMHPVMTLSTGLLIVAIATGASILSCFQALHEAPASLLRPKPPRSGRRVLLERIPFVWRKLSFSGKLITRNMFRNTSRLVIGIIGVVGCSMLLLTGFGLRDSVHYVLSHYFDVNMRYDARVDLNATAPDGYADAVARRADAEYMERVMEGALQLYHDGLWQEKPFSVLEDRHEDVYFETDGGRVWLPEEGIAITRRISEDMSLTVGDSVRLRAPNGHETTAIIQEILDIQLGQGVYLSRSAWRKLDMMPYAPTAVFLNGGNLNMDAIRDMDGVEKARTIEEEKGEKSSVTAVMNLLVLLMSLFAGALLLVVMYTLGELNFFERTRDLATLMVLGFYPRETKRLILRENIIIALIGLPIGLVFAPWLHEWVLQSGLPDVLQFIPYIATESWIYSAALTIFFAWVVNLIIGAKFRSVNMVEALKSVE